MLALSHDRRVMRSDRGYFCLPEVELGLPFTWGMSELIRCRLAPQAAHEAMTTGRRYGGEQALAAGIVEHAVDADEVLPLALRLAGELVDTAGETLGTIKQRLYAAGPGPAADHGSRLAGEGLEQLDDGGSAQRAALSSGPSTSSGKSGSS